MAESLTIARPYAQAAFLFASEHHTLKDWSEMLGLLAAVAADPVMSDMIDNPQLTEKQLAERIAFRVPEDDEEGSNGRRMTAEEAERDALSALFQAAKSGAEPVRVAAIRAIAAR